MSIDTPARPPAGAPGTETAQSLTFLSLLHEHRSARLDQITALMFADSAGADLDPAARARVLTTARRTVEEIDAALSRLDDGSYGVCQGCGERIVAERLLAMPFTRHCVPCAQRGERLR